MSTSPTGIDPGVLGALKAADLKRPAPTRHSLGHAGSLAAASGSQQQLAQHSTLQQLQALTAASVPAPALPSPGGSSSTGGVSSPAISLSGGGGGGDTPPLGSAIVGVGGGRKKRAAAAEQSRVMKKLKTKGHLLE